MAMIRPFVHIIILAYTFVGFFSSPTSAQDQTAADSLLNVLHTDDTISDSSRCVLYYEIAFYSTDPSERIHYAEQALKIAEELQNDQLIAFGLRYKGNGLRSQGQLSEAIKHYLDAASLYAGSNKGLEAGVIYIDLGDIYAIQNNYQNSLNYYRQGINIFRQSKDSVKLATALLNVGELYRTNQKLDSAIVYFQRSKAIFSKIGYAIGLAYNLGNIGLVLAEEGKYELAEENIAKATAILVKIDDQYPIAVFQTALADIYANRGAYDQALVYGHTSLKIGEELGLKEQIRDASLKLSEIYQSAGNSDEAYTYLKQYIAYRDSINNEETIRQMADLRTAYEVSKKQAEVDLLQEQALLNNIVVWCAIFIIALLLILTVALLKIYRIKDRAIRIVRERRRVIAAQRNQLDEVNKTKDRFFSIISHDIRGPISNFQGISGLINVLAESNDADGLKQLGSMMEASAKEVSVLLDNLLEWALSQEGKIPYHAEPVKLKELCQANLGIMLNMAMAKQIELRGRLTQEVIVDADKNSVSTIIRNLLSNAIKFTPEGGEVKLEIAEVDGMGLVSVIDTGIGIPKDKLNDLFQLKGMRSSWGTKGEKGIGLGLTLVYEFVQLNHGQIEVESEEGKGTTFKVYLPLTKKTVLAESN
ncbi:tetratricopeptide repeat-containing sensor histidine kinase [Reichenbachiella carrageenanivorans]|uniref:histidine kinase n=1 Tax=Reichenbachiella carrageenanivorans TaxID=2979869 RepID=A0ABY6D9V6_9BACT|nr:tetratricopeptide repeat-containing sensor histidine kinase [Reichenbachiella carrageenanivorans]UXX80660.1 tetratricopeptide repeat-containing sensor histidine kinase [Reichenbachiella carrageenanivorans]